MNDTMVGNQAQGSPRDESHAHWGAQAAAYEPVLSRIGPYADLVRAVVESQRDSRRVLDQGFGAGVVARSLGEMGARVLAIDPFEDVVRTAASVATPRVVWRRMDPAALELPSAVVDGVVSCNVLHTLPDPFAAVAEACRVLVPGGRFTVSSPRRGFDVSVLDRQLALELTECRDEPHERACRELLNRRHRIVREGLAHVYDPEEFAALLLAESGFRQILDCGTAYLDQNFFVVVRR